MMLTEAEVPGEVIGGSRIFHFGTLSMTHEGVRRATRHAVGCARMGGTLVSFDPNLRPPLWESLEEARGQIAYGLSQCDILKIADNELEFMTGETDLDKGAAALRQQYPNIRLFNVTAGPEGSCSYYEDKRVFVLPASWAGQSKPPGPGTPSAPAFSTSCWSMGWMDWRKRT
jgi:fructokinase